jgi:hypothetical protein
MSNFFLTVEPLLNVALTCFKILLGFANPFNEPSPTARGYRGGFFMVGL